MGSQTSFRIKRICTKDDPENGYNILTLPLPRLILPSRPTGATRNLYNKLSPPDSVIVEKTPPQTLFLIKHKHWPTPSIPKLFPRHKLSYKNTIY